MCLVNRRGLGKAKHVDMQNRWIQEVSTAGRFVTKKVGTNVNPTDLMTKPQPKIEQLVSIMGYESWGIDVDLLEGRSTGVRWYVRDVETSSMTQGTRISVKSSGP